MRKPSLAATSSWNAASIRPAVRSEFHNKLVAGYQEEMSGEKNVLFKMKELWFYLGTQFTGIEKPLKKIKKANSLIEYQAAVSEIFSTGAGK